MEEEVSRRRGGEGGGEWGGEGKGGRQVVLRKAGRDISAAALVSECRGANNIATQVKITQRGIQVSATALPRGVANKVALWLY